MTKKTVVVKVGSEPWTIELNNVKLMRAFNFLAVDTLVNVDCKADACILYGLTKEELEEAIKVVENNSKKYIVYCVELTEYIVEFIEKTGIEYVQSEEKLNDALKVITGQVSEEDLNNPFKLVQIEKEHNTEESDKYINDIAEKLAQAERVSAENFDNYVETKEELDKSLKELSELYEKVSELNKSIEDSKEKLAEANTEIERLSNKNIELEQGLSDNNNSADKIKELTDILDSKEIALQENIELVAKTNGDMTALKESLSILEEEKEGLQNLLQECENKVNDLIDNLQILKEERVEIELECNELKNEVARLTEELEKHSDSNENTDDKTEEIEKELKDSKERVSELENIVKDLESDNNGLVEKLQLLQEEKISNDNKASDEIKDLNSEIERLNAEYNRTTIEFNTIKQLLTDESRKVIELELKLDTQKAAEEDDGIGKKRLKALEELNNQLLATIELNKQSEESYKTKVSTLTKTVRDLEISNMDLKSKVESLGMLANRSVTSGIKLKYEGKAKIIQVYGSGSYGVTSVAISIANRLTTGKTNVPKVAFIDFDLVSPKADAWFGKPPIIKGVYGLKEGSIMNTGLGVMLEKGVDFWIENKSNIIINAADGKCNNTIDYISGLYTRVEMSKIAVSDISEFISYLGNTYDYIVVDSGRVGGSDIQTSIIKAFNSIGSHDVLVSQNNNIDSRSLLLRVKDAKIEYAKQAWVLNLSKTSKIEKSVLDVVRECEMFLLPRDSEIYGEYVTFDKVNILKDRINALVEFLTSH